MPPTYPDVPQLPGVPALPRPPGFASSPQPGEQQPPGTSTSGVVAVWGVFDSAGNPVAAFTSFIGMQFKSDSQVPTFPIENGAFASFNKVIRPKQSLFRFARSGNAADRTTFLAALETAKQSLNLYSIITPDAVYSNMNIVDYAYKRDARDGAYMILVDISAMEIRQVEAQYVTSTAKPSGADPVAGGRVQPVAPTPPVKSALSSLGSSIMGIFQ